MAFSRFQRILADASRGARHWLAARVAGPLLGDIAPPSWQRPQPLEAVAVRLSANGWSRYDEGKGYFLEEGIELLEGAWALAKSADTACRLGAMYERDNRNEDCTRLYREALRRFPHDEGLRCQAAAHLLRHANVADIRGFLDLVRAADAEDPFVSYLAMMLDVHPVFSGRVCQAVAKIPAGLPSVLMCFPVWGADYVRDFVAYACGSLLAPANLPAIAKRYSVHIFVFTTASGEAAIRDCSVFEKLAHHATVHFMHFPDGADEYLSRMTRHYGSHLGELYARTCKFLLFSTSHYATLEAGRRLGAFVMPLAADGVFCDGSLDRMLSLMDGPIDVVAVTGFRLKRELVLSEAEALYRCADGSLCIPESAHAEIIASFVSREYFAESDRFAPFPLMLCWPVAGGGVLVHSTHFHPFCIRASAIQSPVVFTIDPVDGRFLSRCLPDLRRIHLVTDMGISISDWSDAPLFEEAVMAPMIPERVSMFLWMYWDSLREHYFRTPIRVGASIPASDWVAVEGQSQALVDKILSGVRRHDERHLSRSSWTQIPPR